MRMSCHIVKDMDHKQTQHAESRKEEQSLKFSPELFSQGKQPSVYL